MQGNFWWERGNGWEFGIEGYFHPTFELTSLSLLDVMLFGPLMIVLYVYVHIYNGEWQLIKGVLCSPLPSF